MILITGGGGLIGLHLARAFAEQGHHSLLLQRHATKVPAFLAPFWGREVQEALGDVLDRSFLQGLISRHSIESIVHGAAIIPGGDRTLHDIVSINVVATLNVLEIARICHLRRVSFISSSTVYAGLSNDTDCTEDLHLPIGPAHAISATKKAAEQICVLYQAEGSSVPLIRVSRVYGPGNKWRQFPLERMVLDTVAGKPADIPDADEHQRINVIYAKDCATGIVFIHMAPELRHNIYNLSDGNFVSYGDVARMVKEIVPEATVRMGNGAVSSSLANSRMEDPHPRVRIDRLVAEGWTPRYADLREGLQAYVTYLKTGSY